MRLRSTTLLVVLHVAISFTTAQANGTLLYDHLLCYKLDRDTRTVSTPVPLLQLTPKQIDDFAVRTGCRIRPDRPQRARELCVPVAKSPSGPPAGPEIEADYACYRVRCEDAVTGSATTDATDQFGGGQVTVRQRKGSRRLCAPVPKSTGCRIDGELYPSGAPNGPCQSCQPAVSTTEWTNVPDGTGCSDGEACTTNDACLGGVCSGVEVDCQCHTQGSTCDPATGLCSNAPKHDGEPCDDGVACTEDDFCFNGQCTGEPNCPTTSCAVSRCNTDTGLCELEPVVCRQPESDCYATFCQGTTGVCVTTCAASECGTGCDFAVCGLVVDCIADADCNDDNPCTLDRCIPIGRICGSGGSLGGICSNSPVTCSDGNPCTFDYCDPKFGCVNQGQNPDVICDDNIACTRNVCDYATGCQLPGEPVDEACDDGESCTVDTCDPQNPESDPATGCVFDASGCGGP